MKVSKDMLFRVITYFKRGHAAYFALCLSMLNFFVIQYRLLIEKIPFLQSIFPRFWIFIITFGITYFFIAFLVGYWDMKRGSYIQESSIIWDNNPRARELVNKVRKIEKDIEEIKKILKEVIKK